MKTMLELIPIGLYIVVGLISLVMAYKSTCSNRFLPFHEKAAGKSWDDVEPGLRWIILALMRVSGLGFLVVALQLLIFPLVNLFRHDPWLQYGIPVISLVFCLGLFLINYQLAVHARSKTPWKGALYAGALIAIGILISFMI
jgi:hypothetical protein